jgi:hypothetical protein
MGGRPPSPGAADRCVSGFAVRAVELAAVIDCGRQGNPDRPPLVRALIHGYTAALELAEGLGPGLARALGPAAGLMPCVTALPAPT